MDARVALYIARGEEIFVTLPPLPAFVNDSLSQMQLHFKTTISQSVKVYPNPAKEQLFVHYQLPEISDKTIFRLFDMTGKQCTSLALDNHMGELTIDLSGYAPGIYYYQVMRKGQVVASNKIAVVKVR